MSKDNVEFYLSYNEFFYVVIYIIYIVAARTLHACAYIVRGDYRSVCM